MKIKAVALTRDNIEKDSSLWTKVDAGEFNIVYMTPEVAMAKKGHFSEVTVRGDTKFHRRLVVVAVDECHLIWDWESFRVQYRYIGNIRLWLGRVPWMCLSATLMPSTGAYVHQVCKLETPTVRYNLSTRRDNLNFVVVEKYGTSFRQLEWLIPENIRDHLQIKKSIIFHDNIDNLLRLAQFLTLRLPRQLSGHPPDTIVAVYFGSIDGEQKSKIQTDFEAGRTRILVCTDAFGLGVNIKDIAVVIQWGIDEKCNINHLSQRLGRAVRNPHLEGIGIVYVSKSAVYGIARENETLETWEDAWNDPNLLATPDSEDDDDGDDDTPRVIPVSKERKLARFGLPVRQDTRIKVKTHVRNLYREAKSEKEAHLEAVRERRGTFGNPVTMAKKIDPAVLWFLRTEGCRHAVLGSVYNDPLLWNRSHQYWCCDNCVINAGSNLRQTSTAGFTAAYSISNPEKITLENQIFIPPLLPHEQVWDVPITPERTDRVELRLKLTRSFIWERLNIPDSTPSLILPDKPLINLVKHVKRITTLHQLTLQLEKSGMLIQSSLLDDDHLHMLMWAIEGALTEEIIAGTILFLKLLNYFFLEPSIQNTPPISARDPSAVSSIQQETIENAANTGEKRPTSSEISSLQHPRKLVASQELGLSSDQGTDDRSSRRRLKRNAGLPSRYEDG